jgi:hypothetical protein
MVLRRAIPVSRFPLAHWPTHSAISYPSPLLSFAEVFVSFDPVTPRFLHSSSTRVYTEYRGSTFLRNIGSHFKTTRRHSPEGLNRNIHSREKLKSDVIYFA